MKRCLAWITMVAVLLTLVAPLQAFAAYDKDLEKAIGVAKSLFSISNDYDSFDYSMHKEKDRTMFNLRWSGSKNNVGDINVTIDSQGKVNSYYSYKPYTGRQKRLPTVSKSDALKIAETFIRKVNPSIAGNIEYIEENVPLNINDGVYRFLYCRVENGAPYPENNVNIEVDSRTGEVRSYYCNWNDEVKFPGSAGAMLMEQAKQEYMNKLGLKLVYKLNFDQKEQKPYLVYTNVYNNHYIDAVTGEVVNGNGFYYGFGRNEKSADMGAGLHSYAENKPALTPQEQKAVESAAGIMDQNTAEDTARTALKISQTYKLNYISLYNNWQNKEDYIWSMDFGKDNKSGEERYEGVNVSVDAKTGSVLSFYRFSPYDSNSVPKYSKEQALKKAEDFIKTMQPKELAEAEQTPWSDPVYDIMKGSEQPRQYYFTFTRKANGAYFIVNGFNVTVDTITGDVINYNFNWYKKDLPSGDKIITSAEAHDFLFKEVGIQQQYISLIKTSAGDKFLPTQRETPELVLVYAIKPGKPINIDAISGALLDYNGKPFEGTDVSSYEDIKGHYAENMIKVLTEYGISLPGKKLQPNKNISQKEFLFLLKATNSWVSVGTLENLDEDTLYNTLINAGIVKADERMPGSAVQRQDAVKFLVRALNYDKVAEIDSKIFKVPFKDANKIRNGLYGYMAIGYGLNLIGGSDGYCDPAGSLTRAQGFVLIYNFLNV